MRSIVRLFIFPFYKLYASYRISKSEECTYKNLKIFVPVGVFHPLIFFSTKLLITEVESRELSGKRVLDIGCGSGLVGMIAAQKGAVVTALDVSPLAIETTGKNFSANDLTCTLFLSDLFDDIPEQKFDFIFINPPYYRKKAKTIEDRAWFAGEGNEYFVKLFAQLKTYIHAKSEIRMVLSEDVDIHSIRETARLHQFSITEVRSVMNLLEKGFVFSIAEQRVT